MKIISWNVNGIRAIAKKGFLEWFNGVKPDILCLQETKAMPEQLTEELLSPEGYKTFWNNPLRKGYAGVSVFSRIEPVTVAYDFPSGKIDTEGRALVLDYGDFVLLNVYFPNGGRGPERLSYKLEFYDRFLEYIDDIKNRKIIVCGDVNTAHKEIDLARPKENAMFTGFLPEERAWIDKLVAHGYVDAFRYFDKGPGKYTWWDYKTRARERNVGWRIDYFFATKPVLSRIDDSFILSDVTGSDHCPLGIILGES